MNPTTPSPLLNISISSLDIPPGCGDTVRTSDIECGPGQVRRALSGALGAQNAGVLWWEGSESSWTALFGSGYAPDARAKFVARPALLTGFA